MNTALAALFVGKAALAPSNQIQFIYEPYDTGSATCTQSVPDKNNPYDHLVVCTDENKVKHSFTAHLALNKYTHPTPPMVTYELMYWVNDNGATSLFNFDKDTTLITMESSQSITGEGAGLRLKIALP